MRRLLLYVALCSVFASLCACRTSVDRAVATDEEVSVYPDYKDVTIPYNIAPIDFAVDAKGDYLLTVEGECGSFCVRYGRESFRIPSAKWRKMLQNNRGRSLKLTIFERRNRSWAAFKPFEVAVAQEPVDDYIAYRLIAPGYELWSTMGIYQREVGSFDQSCIVRNSLTDRNCINCHSFCMQDPDKMLFHSRAKHAGTIVVDSGRIEKLDTRTAQTISPLVYPSWHPSGQYVAFSVNATRQSFHVADPNRIEVFDSASDVVAYDTRRHLIASCDLLSSPDSFETFPTFAPDGRTLYFCSARAVDSLPFTCRDVRYDLCSIAFDPDNMTFGNTVDTLCKVSDKGHSISFPRISPDGKYLAFTLHGYGNFSIWHNDADLCMIDLTDRRVFPLDKANSDSTESYHSWSSNSRWLVFGSRRDDGLYTRPYISYVDSSGEAHKPFMLPQRNPRHFYQSLLLSYNIPEFVTGKVKVKPYRLARKIANDSSIDSVTYRTEP